MTKLAAIPMFLATLLLAAPACQRSQPVAPETTEDSQFESKPVKVIDGYATWYEVPEGSPVARRADGAEMTAAFDQFALGTFVRVTSRKSGRRVIVKITDRGVPGRTNIDLCKEAAEELGIVKKGRAKVRMEVLRERPETGEPTAEKAQSH